MLKALLTNLTKPSEHDKLLNMLNVSSASDAARALLNMPTEDRIRMLLAMDLPRRVEVESLHA